ncbi:MAG: hypothetical protein ACP5N7_03460 [Candidatus Pacearchaeota archaeon]
MINKTDINTFNFNHPEFAGIIDRFYIQSSSLKVTFHNSYNRLIITGRNYTYTINLKKPGGRIRDLGSISGSIDCNKVESIESYSKRMKELSEGDYSVKTMLNIISDILALETIELKLSTVPAMLQKESMDLIKKLKPATNQVLDNLYLQLKQIQEQLKSATAINNTTSDARLKALIDVQAQLIHQIKTV